MPSVTNAAPKSAAPRRSATDAATPVRRVRSQDLFDCTRELEIEHEGRIYRLRMTQLNKLILTA